MARIGENSGPRRHGGKMAAFAFGAQLLLDVTLCRHQADQGLGLMSIELISDEDPGGLWIGLDGLHDMSGKVRFGACRSYARCHDLPASHVEVGNQTLRAMPLVFEFLALDMTGLDGQGWVQTFQGLHTSHAHRYSSHVCPLPQASLSLRRPRIPCRSAQPVQWGHQVVE